LRGRQRKKEQFLPRRGGKKSPKREGKEDVNTPGKPDRQITEHPLSRKKRGKKEKRALLYFTENKGKRIPSLPKEGKNNQKHEKR